MQRYLGEIILMPQNITIENYMQCDGKQLMIDRHQQLFNLLGIKYGGDGKNFFCLPNLYATQPSDNCRFVINTRGYMPISTQSGVVDELTTNSYIGEIVLFPYDFIPVGYIECNRKDNLLPIRDFVDLFSLIGLEFGGDGIASFGIPFLYEAVPDSQMVYCIAYKGIYPPRPQI